MLAFFMSCLTAVFVYATVFLVLLRIVIAFKIRWGSTWAMISVVIINVLSLVAAVLFVTL